MACHFKDICKMACHFKDICKMACHEFVSEGISLTLSSIYTHSNTLKKKALGKHCGKR